MTDRPEYDGDIQEQTLPKVHQRRLVLEQPRLIDLSSLYEKLQEAGVPNHAHIRFTPWNIPRDRFYIVAAWPDADADATVEDPSDMQDW